MKHAAGPVPPRRLARPRSAARLNLRRARQPEPDDHLESGPKSSFGSWFALVALLHILAIAGLYLFFEHSSPPKPPEQFMQLLPAGEVVKGTPGTKSAPKVGASTSAQAAHHTPEPPKPVIKPAPAAETKPAPIAPPKPPVIPPPPKPLAEIKPTPAPVPKPKPPKVKIDLTLADGPTPPVTKPKKVHHTKKPVTPAADTADDNSDNTSAATHSTGLTREEIAAKLGAKLDDAGVKDAVKSGTSGAANEMPNQFANFYAALRDQVMGQWTSPNLADDTAINPIVQIHVERDGRVPPESVVLIQSSGNSAYDDSALTAAKSLGYLHEPLPDGCPPDIPITFKLTR